jgi:hypothetical protein
MHARLVSASHTCVQQCRWRLCTGMGLDLADPEDLYVAELITQMQLDVRTAT